MRKVVVIVPLWKRILAYIIDSLLISVIIVSPLMVKETGESFIDFLNLIMSSNFWFATIIAGIMTLVYWTFLEWKFGQSVGKIFFKIKSVGINDKEITISQAFIRNLSKLSSVILFLDVLYMLISKGNQRFFEKISNTKVVGVIEDE